MYPDNLPRRERAAILSEQQGHRCCYCGVRFSEQMPADIRLYLDPRPSVEHVVRLADGGEKNWWNEVAACRGCNSARGKIRPERFYEIVSTLGTTEIRRVLRTSMSAKKRSRATRAANAETHRHAKTVGAKWPPIIGELPMTPERAAYLEEAAARYIAAATVPAPKGLATTARQPDPRFVQINGIRALRWNVRNVPTP